MISNSTPNRSVLISQKTIEHFVNISGATTDIYEMFNGLLKQLKKFEWLKVTRGHDYNNRSTSFPGLLEAIKDPHLYLGSQSVLQLLYRRP
jgi:hypothetical protein